MPDVNLSAVLYKAGDVRLVGLMKPRGCVVLASRLPAAAKLTVVLSSRCDLVTEALASLLSGFIEALSTLTAI